jgi:predicted dehydrogenase
VEPASQFGSLHVRGEPTATQVPTAPGRWAEYYQRIALAIRRGGEPPVSLADALTSTALIAGGLESALTGQAVPIKNYYE